MKRCWWSTLLAQLLLCAATAQADYLDSKICDEEGAECAVYTDNFLVNYHPADTTDAYAVHILGSMETAYQKIFVEWQYACPVSWNTPAWMSTFGISARSAHWASTTAFMANTAQ
ncbi:MAG: hypothetical protein P8Q36_09630 [Alphaproteobacteria bacterium]|jgi:hypothetical protein|nr:hypothetical protein [Rhodospirillaceae bacterium]MBT6510778.1 hypothetical protein [Rhodospirillaceae bacterium]MBT7645803.1 hypothetical protein [Rhodospirillaceae bacterium]MDG2481110.1 hypothetical protein [Alphaproteobacteria bacterium]